jgi:hypothetical protein
MGEKEREVESEEGGGEGVEGVEGGHIPRMNEIHHTRSDNGRRESMAL